MSLYLDIEEQRLQPFSDAVLNALLTSVQEALHGAIEKNLLAAHEAMESARHKMLLDEIANLQENFALLSSNVTIDVSAILQFEEKYRDLVGSVHAFIKPPHLESGRRVPIDDIFVAPRISTIPRQKTREPDAVELSAFLSGLYRGVLLGNPGGGKSTASAKICHDLATRYSERLFAGREVTPVLVVLREFGIQKKLSGCSIAQFIEMQSNSRYQLDPPPNAFQYLLLNGRLIVIFDGLDELLDTSYRQEITSNVESFCKLYPSVPVLVTSREVGYEQAPLDEKLFRMFRLAPFNEDQVKEYADKWFARDEEYTPEQKAAKARAFFSDSSLVQDLRSNPLMLGLMCNLYRAEGYIPRNRPEVYSKCSLMLFEKWDKARDILVPLPFEEHLRPAMEDLAYWIYSNDDLQGGVTETSLVENASTYLNKWVFDDVRKSIQAAREFIQFCTGRAWVFTDTGTTKDGERLFQFSHRTFLEYFTACHLVSIHPTPDPLAGSLKPRIAKREWDVVAQLAFQIQSKRVQGAADRLLELLLEPDASSWSGTWNKLSFAERCLEFLVPSPAIRRQITKAALNFWSASARQGSFDGVSTFPESRLELAEHISNLLLATAENRTTIGDEFENYLEKTILSPDVAEASLAAELSLILMHPTHLISSRSISVDAQNFWSEIANRVVNVSIAKILELAAANQSVCIRCCWDGMIATTKAVEYFGLSIVFLPVRASVMDSWYFPQGYMLAGTALGAGWAGDESKDRQLKNMRDLEALAEVFISIPTPWIGRARSKGRPFGNWMLGIGGRMRRGTRLLPRSNRVDFAVLCLLAVEIEMAFSGQNANQLGSLLEHTPHIPAEMKRFLCGRVSDDNRQEALRVLASFTFSEEQRNLLASWVNCEVNFTRSSVGSPSKKRQRGKV